MMRKAATIMTMPSALEISWQATLKPVTEIAADAGLPPWLIEPYGEHVAKIDLAATHPAAEHMDIDADGRIVGLS
jgi:formate--tetrahydrofolate ligase